ncbi:MULTISPECIES: ATP-binding protein [unclassified Geodermatophilus]|uniref:ATP-binding protein n=1 Tax=unclassified Geodermatophilus TaxID=2637632 RepID=UPI003EEB224E
MDEAQWAHRPTPEVGADVTARWSGEPATAEEVSALRRQLRGALRDGSLPAGEDDAVDLLLLVFEELVSNGLRHGRPPVRVAVTAVGTGWLLEVSDAAVDRLPTPAIGRDAAAGGLGLHLVARLCAGHGWTVREGRKHVWCRVSRTAAATGSAPDRSRR